ncbi:MAG: F-type H+-transporting ATPase subunit epsilon [Chthoniobacter sp.]|jgi:F-type H+-transporting ATPase subunit epsilon|nr:F-type H+-transporting ATPase subunit epsilon [Chthoniobacter sp.]
MATLRLEITTPDAKVYSDDVDMVVVPGVEGELGILPRHIPLLTAIKPGELKVTKNGQNTYLAVGEGFVEVTQERVSVLADMALEEKAIDEAAAQEAVRRAEEAMKHPNIGHEEVAAVQATLQKSLAQLHVKRRRHT